MLALLFVIVLSAEATTRLTDEQLDLFENAILGFRKTGDDEAIKVVFNLIDEDSNNEVDLEEFCYRFFAPADHPLDENMLPLIFDSLDNNKDGVITIEEVSSMLTAWRDGN